MSRGLPPLNALRAFEAAGRHLSFKKAAEELRVTPGAISHQLELLEHFLGVRLFRRLHRRIELTRVARACLPKLHEGFKFLRETIDEVRDQSAADSLMVSAPPSFTSCWLMPRLHRFVMAHPGIDVLISTKMPFFGSPPRHRTTEIDNVLAWTNEGDVVVAYGTGDYPGLQVHKLMSLSITPLCSPATLTGKKALRKLADLRQCTLIHDDRGLLYQGQAFWDTWLKEANVKGVNAAAGIHFTHAQAALEAAVEGIGVVATTPELASNHLESGKLVAPFALRLPHSYGYYIVGNELTAKQPVVSIFRDWLLNESRAAGHDVDIPGQGRSRRTAQAASRTRTVPRLPPPLRALTAPRR